jgi:hypothetical protein
MIPEEAWDGIMRLSYEIAIRMTGRLEEWVALCCDLCGKAI